MSDPAFTSALKAAQRRKGSRAPTALQRDISDELTAFIAKQTNVYLATSEPSLCSFTHCNGIRLEGTARL